MDPAKILQDTSEKIKLMQTQAELEAKLAKLKDSQYINMKGHIKELKIQLDSSIVTQKTTEVAANEVRNHLIELRNEFKVNEIKLNELRQDVNEKAEIFVNKSYEYLATTNEYLHLKEKIKLEKEKLNELKLSLAKEQARLDGLNFMNARMKNLTRLKDNTKHFD